MALIDRIGLWLGSLAVRHPWKVIVLSLLCVAPLAYGAKRAFFSSDYRVFFAAEDPQMQAFNRLEHAFTPTDNVVFVARPRSGDVFSTRALLAVQALTEGGWHLPYASRVDSLSNFQYSHSVDEELVVEDLVGEPASNLSQTDLARIRRIALADPLLRGALISPDGRTSGVSVTLRLPRQGPLEVAESVAAARALVARMEAQYPEIEFHTSGMALFNDAFREASLRDLNMLVPIMYIVMLLTMTFMLRSFFGTLAVTSIVAIASLAAVGFAGWVGYPLTPPSACAPTIVLTLAVAEGIHIVISVQKFLRMGRPKADAIMQAMRSNLRAISLTSCTTVFGFLCLNYADSPPYGHLANMTSIGIVIAFLLSITLLPALLSLVPLKASQNEEAGYRWSRTLSSFVIRHYRAVLFLSFALFAASAFFVWNMKTEDRFLEYFSDSIRFRPDTEFMLRNLTGVYSLEYQIGSGAGHGVTHPDYLEKLDAFATWLRAQPEVRHVYSFSDIFKRLNFNMMNDAEGSYRLPASREAASQYLLLYEMSLPNGIDLNDRLDVNRSTSRLSVLINNLTSTEIRAFAARTEDWLRVNTPRPMWSLATSPVVVFSYMSDRNARSMTQGNIVDLIVMSLVLIFAFRSFRLGALSMIANVLPIMLAYGLWSLVVGDNNIIVSVTGTICLGIVVDDTIHFMSKYRAARRRNGMSTEAAILHTFGGVGVALVVTTFVLVIGFGVLTLSGFSMNRQFGLLSMTMIGIALFGDLFVLPALLMVFDRRSYPVIDDSHSGEVHA